MADLPAQTHNGSPLVRNGQPGRDSTQNIRPSTDRVLQRKRAVAFIKLSMSNCWSAIRDLGPTARQKCSLSTWLGIAASIIIGGLGLRYAYEQQMLAFESMRLAEWTARKDFRELCQEQTQATTLGSKCELVLRNPFPEPPYVNFERWKRAQGQRDTTTYNRHTYPVALDLSPMQNIPANNAHLHFYPWTAILTLCFLLFCCRRRIRRLPDGFPPRAPSAEPYGAWRNSSSLDGERPIQWAPKAAEVTTSIEAPARNNLRHRNARKQLDEPSNIWKAAETGSVEDVERHLRKGTNVNIHAPSHGTPLSVAAHHGRYNVVELLLSHGADPRRRNGKYKENALQAASEGGYENIVSLLLDHGADMNAEIGGLRAICAAAWRGHSNVVRALIDRGAQDDLLKGFSTNGIRLSADHANRMEAGFILNSDLSWSSRVFAHLDPERRGPASSGAEQDTGGFDFMNAINNQTTRAAVSWLGRLDDGLEDVLRLQPGSKLERQMLAACADAGQLEGKQNLDRMILEDYFGPIDDWTCADMYHAVTKIRATDEIEYQYLKIFWSEFGYCTALTQYEDKARLPCYHCRCAGIQNN